MILRCFASDTMELSDNYYRLLGINPKSLFFVVYLIV